MHLPLLTLTIFTPLFGALLVALAARGESEKSANAARIIALAASAAALLLSIHVLEDFNPANTGFQFIERHEWMPDFGIAYLLGVDGISLWFILASAFLIPLCIIASWRSVTARVPEFMIALLVLETMMLGMFAALDLVLFYLFFESVLIPMFLIIGIWGAKGKIYAAYKFFLYTFAGSVVLLIALIAAIAHAGTADMTQLIHQGFPTGLGLLLWAGFFIGFAVKTPMWPFHTWLPYAHVEAPTAGSAILAGVLLKMGGYGLIRVNLQMLPEASHYFLPLVAALSVIAIIYTSLVALVQSDMKKLIAYSSVAHMAYATLGIFVGNIQGLEGAMMVMLSHTVVASALFLCVGVVYDRLHTRDIARYGGLANTMPRYAVFFMLFTLASIGLPGTSGFVGEFLSLQGAFLYSGKVAAFAAVGLVLGAAYMLWMYRRVFYGESQHADAAAMPDLGWREMAVFAPLAILVLWMGIYPEGVKRYFSPKAQHIIAEYNARISAVQP